MCLWGRMLRAILIIWKKHPTKRHLYSKIPLISKTIRERRTIFAGQLEEQARTCQRYIALDTSMDTLAALATQRETTSTNCVTITDVFLKIFRMQ